MAARGALPDKAFLGVGWAHPVGVDGTGEIATAAYEEDIRQAVRIILGTRPGERLMRPEFGAGLSDLAFEPISTTTLTVARHRVTEALVRWEPRIDHIAVTVTAEPPTGRLDIAIRYRVRATNTFYNLVYPFYLTEGREEP
jgi:hypothetical protein